ncbi:MAG: hypothetical protein LBT97_00995 [Planctomycetota bacterium]|jgi:hypothetical protein|nr:hypothetical protein [Planctomycetota bacterium]
MIAEFDRNRNFRCRAAWFAAALSAVLSLMHGCADMPVVGPPPGEEQAMGDASIVFGPYLTSADRKQPVLRFISNRRCVAGLQALDSGSRRVNRQGSFSLFHALAIPDLVPSTLRRYQLLLDDKDGGIHPIKGLPANGQGVAVGFAGGRAEPSRLAAVGRGLRSMGPDAALFLTSPFGGERPERPEDWANLFMGPLGATTEFGPLWFVPGSGLPEQLFPEHQGEGGYWKRDVGALRIIAIDARAFSFEQSRIRAMARLERDLDPAHRQRAWTVVALPRPVFDARIADGRILDALGDRLEAGGVDLVVCGGAPYYLRTRPFETAGSGQTRYVALADTPSGPPPGMQPREYVAAMSGSPHMARLWVDEGSLEWQVFDLEGRPVDRLTLEYRRRPIEPGLSKADVLIDAQATLNLQKEIMRIVRQAARAVPSPESRQMLALQFANPSTRRFSGQIAWDVVPGSGWSIEPMVMPFDLQPGQGAVARFGVMPGDPQNPPRVAAAGADVGTTDDILLLTREVGYDVRVAPTRVRLDARVRDKDYWEQLPSLDGFAGVADGQTVANQTEARIMADRRGLIVALSMRADLASAANPAASDPDRDRDGPVLSDESVEVWLDPERRGRDYYRFAVNPRNVAYDESSRDGVAYNPQWPHAVRFGRVSDREVWNAEMIIPWTALDLAGPPASGAEWGMQIVRRDYSALRGVERRRGRDKPAPVVSQWVDTRGANNRPGLYGVLRFGDMSSLAVEETPAESEGAAPGGFVRGGSLPARPGGGFVPPPSAPEPPAPDLQ